MEGEIHDPAQEPNFSQEDFPLNESLEGTEAPGIFNTSLWKSFLFLKKIPRSKRRTPGDAGGDTPPEERYRRLPGEAA